MCACCCARAPRARTERAAGHHRARQRLRVHARAAREPIRERVAAWAVARALQKPGARRADDPRRARKHGRRERVEPAPRSRRGARSRFAVGPRSARRALVGSVALRERRRPVRTGVRVRIERRLGVVAAENRLHLGEVHEEVAAVEPRALRRALQPFRPIRAGSAPRAVVSRRSLVRRVIRHRVPHEVRHLLEHAAFFPDKLQGRGARRNLKRDVLKGAAVPVGRRRRDSRAMHITKPLRHAPCRLVSSLGPGRVVRCRDGRVRAREIVVVPVRNFGVRETQKPRLAAADVGAGVRARAVRPRAVQPRTEGRPRTGGRPRTRGVRVEQILLPFGSSACARAGHHRERLGFALRPKRRRSARGRRLHGRVPDDRRRVARERRTALGDAIPAARASVERVVERRRTLFLDGCASTARAVRHRRLLGERRSSRCAAPLAGGELPAESDDGVCEGAELVRLLAVVAPTHERVAGVHGNAAGHAPVHRAHHHQALRAIQDVRRAPLGGARARHRALAPPAEGGRARARGGARRAARVGKDRGAPTGLGRAVRAGGLVRSQGSGTLGRRIVSREQGRDQRASHHPGGVRGVVHDLARARAALGGRQRLVREVPLIRAPRERAALVGDVRAKTREVSRCIAIAARGRHVRAGETIHRPAGSVETLGFDRSTSVARARGIEEKSRDTRVRVTAFVARRAVFSCAVHGHTSPHELTTRGGRRKCRYIQTVAVSVDFCWTCGQKNRVVCGRERPSSPEAKNTILGKRFFLDHHETKTPPRPRKSASR